MLSFNFLPWREQQRSRQLKQFYLGIVGYFSAGLLVLWLFSWLVTFSQRHIVIEVLQVQQSKASYQRSYVRLQARREKLLTQLRALEQQRMERWLLPKLIQMLATSSHPGLTLETLAWHNDRLQLQGRVANEDQWVAFITKLEHSTWVKSLFPQRVVGINQSQKQGLQFEIFVVGNMASLH